MTMVVDFTFFFSMMFTVIRCSKISVQWQVIGSIQVFVKVV